MWKSPAESPSALSYCEPQHGRDVYPSPKFSSGARTNSSIGFSGNNSLPAVSSPSTYWSNPKRVETAVEPFASVNKESAEKRPGTSNGCMLFGIQLVDNSTIQENSPLTEDRLLPSLGAESDGHSEPLNVNRTDVPSLSCEPEMSCIRTPQESQSKHIRSCTKVLTSLLSRLFYLFIFLTKYCFWSCFNGFDLFDHLLFLELICQLRTEEHEIDDRLDFVPVFML